MESTETSNLTNELSDDEIMASMEPELIEEMERLRTTVGHINEDNFKRMTEIQNPVPESKSKVYLTGFGQVRQC